MKLKQGRRNLALTIFVPWKCFNNCPFCTSKFDYQNTENFSLQNIIKTLTAVYDQKEIVDIVISGGEPLSDIKGLYELLENIELLNEKSKFKKNVFINSTLPKLNKNDEQLFYQLLKRFSKLICSFNVSRHIDYQFNKKCNDEYLYDIKVNGIDIKINSTIVNDWINPTEEDKNKVKEFINFWLKYSNAISLRWDYRKVNNLEELKTFNNPFLLFLASFLKYDSSYGCQVCHDNSFENFRVHFHRGYKNTLIKFGDYLLVNDIIIKQDGSLHLDWDSEEINPSELIFQ